MYTSKQQKQRPNLQKGLSEESEEELDLKFEGEEEEENSSDTEEPVVFPFSQKSSTTSTRTKFSNKPPSTGEEYLNMVKSEANKIPNVFVAKKNIRENIRGGGLSDSDNDNDNNQNNKNNDNNKNNNKNRNKNKIKINNNDINKIIDNNNNVKMAPWVKRGWANTKTTLIEEQDKQNRENGLVNEEWEKIFLERFEKLREELQKHIKKTSKLSKNNNNNDDDDDDDDDSMKLPKSKDEAGWLKFCYGLDYPLSPLSPLGEGFGSFGGSFGSFGSFGESFGGGSRGDDNDDDNNNNEKSSSYSKKGKELKKEEQEEDNEEVATMMLPSLNIISRLDQATTISLLSYHTKWLDTGMTITKSQWIFALLIRIDQLLTSNQMVTLREMCRKCITIRKNLVIRKDLMKELFTVDNEDDTTLASLNMIITIIRNYFGQRDLG
ncbi:hypothetical protein Glove_586g25 [Diversispora epigaea]|uniref:Uncharacterized protein n=1 Tax=Diversispora epigaea TaxID=1348612 RepID=A0A397GAX5_9GLOM|nr:hypothetical protein Glove_586g25 [Diversispora epigaea]